MASALLILVKVGTPCAPSTLAKSAGVRPASAQPTRRRPGRLTSPLRATFPDGPASSATGVRLEPSHTAQSGLTRCVPPPVLSAEQQSATDHPSGKPLAGSVTTLCPRNPGPSGGSNAVSEGSPVLRRPGGAPRHPAPPFGLGRPRASATRCYVVGRLGGAMTALDGHGKRGKQHECERTIE
jgi:hypothetical protein